jgi:hypothetical protein
MPSSLEIAQSAVLPTVGAGQTSEEADGPLFVVDVEVYRSTVKP